MVLRHLPLSESEVLGMRCVKKMGNQEQEDVFVAVIRPKSAVSLSSKEYRAKAYEVGTMMLGYMLILTMHLQSLVFFTCIYLYVYFACIITNFNLSDAINKMSTTIT